MNVYVVGFIWDNSNNVLLIRKNKPEWQAGLLNGPGGKIEAEDNSAAEAITREMREETGLTLYPGFFKIFATIYGDTYLVHFFSGKIHQLGHDMIHQLTDEKVEIHNFNNFHKWKKQCVPNLEILLPLSKYEGISYATFQDLHS